MAKYILKAFFLTTFPSTQKKYPKIYAVTLVLFLKISGHWKYVNPSKKRLLDTAEKIINAERGNEA